jgi:hypothetical protein
MTAARHAITAAVLCGVVAAPAAAEVFVYPKQGQSQQQFEQDQFSCHNWAKQQTGVDPSQSYASASPQTAPQTGGALRGGARGAAVGAIGGAIGGAGVGAATGAIRQRSANEQAAAANQQAMAQQQQSLGRYDQAYAACMGGRGYQVK